MKNLYYIFILISALIGIPVSVSAANDLNSRFDNYTVSDGLSNNIVQCVMQDSEGYIWIGTSQGLNRFDGYSFTVFRSLQSKEKNVKGELIRCIFEDSHKRFWVGTENGGMYKYDRGVDTFKYVPLNNDADGRYSANTIVEDMKGNLWVGTDDGLARLGQDEELYYHHFSSEDYKDFSQIKICRVDSLNRIWAGTSQDGVFVYDIQKDILRNISSNQEVRTLTISKDNTVWIGTYENGVYTANALEKDHIEAKQVKELPTTGGLATVKAIIEDNEGLIWVGTREGLICFDRETNKWQANTHDVHNKISLAQNSVVDLFVDSKGDLWVGTRGGLSYRDREKQAFILLQEAKNDNRYLNCAQVYAFYEVSPNEIWIGTESGGINIYNTESKTFTYITKENSGLSSNCIKSLQEVEGRLLVGTYMGGLNIVDMKSRKVVAKYTTLPNNNIWDIRKCRNGDVLLATSEGILKFDVKSGKATPIEYVASGKEVLRIYEDSDGDLWILTPDEIFVRQVRESSTINYFERARSIVQGDNNIFYVGSNEKGILVYSKFNGLISTIDEAKGLCNNNVVSLLNKNGKIFAATTRGLSIVDVASESLPIINLDEIDGLQSRQFHYGAAMVRENGEIVLGGNAGVNIFDAELIKPNDFVPPVLISEIKVFNEVLPPSNIEQDKNGVKHISVEYDKNIFSFKFSALSYSKSAKNEFKYRLNNGAWIDAGAENKCIYSNLEPGEYIFQVKGSNCDGVWSETCDEVHITVFPPFWSSWWFRLICALLIVVGIVVATHFYKKRLKLKNALDLEKRKAEEIAKLEQMKLDFFTNISHELRTPITLILGPISKILNEQGISTDTQQMAELAQRNANQLLTLVNQVLDFRKIESGTLTVAMKEGDLVAFLSSIYRSFVPNAESRGVVLSYELDRNETAPLLNVLFDNDKLSKIINNLLSNSLKFTPQGGNVSLSLSYISNHKFTSTNVANAYQIRVKDSGRGISEEDKKHIFERFYQSKGTDAHIGTGIGLSLVYDFVKLMNGDIELESKEGEGSEFIITLPAIAGEKKEEAAEELQTENVEEQKGDAEPTPAIAGETPILLIVEDNEELRNFCVSHFEKKFKVMQAGNGVDAMKLAEEQIPDIIITDLVMPQMCGDELCAKIKQDERTSHIPLILLTAIHSKETEYQVLKCGADDFITKPFDIDILQQKMENILAMREMMRKRFKIEQIAQPKNVETQSPDEKFMLKAMQVIEDNISDPDFDIEQLASESGVSRMQLYRKMNALTGMTVKEFIRNIRIKRAKQLLEQGNLTVSEIAYEVGFRDIAYFRKCFKNHFGINPSEVKVQ